MSKYHRLFVIPTLLNLVIWSYKFWEDLTFMKITLGWLSLCVSYVLFYMVIRAILESYIDKSTNELLNYLSENHQLEKVKIDSRAFLGTQTDQYTSYVFTLLIIIDTVALFKLDFSVLSVFNYILF